MNTLLSEAAIAAIRRIETLKEVARKTGFQTHNEQFKILLALSDEDMRAVADKITISRTQPIVSRPRTEAEKIALLNGGRR